MRYRKLPVEVDAEQFKIASLPWPTGVIKLENQDIYVIETLNGSVPITDGEWVVTGVENEKYPCKDTIFHKTYEPIKDTKN